MLNSICSESLSSGDNSPGDFNILIYNLAILGKNNKQSELDKLNPKSKFRQSEQVNIKSDGVFDTSDIEPSYESSHSSMFGNLLPDVNRNNRVIYKEYKMQQKEPDKKIIIQHKSQKVLKQDLYKLHQDHKRIEKLDGIM